MEALVFDFVCFAVEECEAALAFVAAAELAFDPDVADAGFFAVAVFVLAAFAGDVLLEESCAKSLPGKKQKQTAAAAQTAPNHPVKIFPRSFGSNEKSSTSA